VKKTLAILLILSLGFWLAGPLSGSATPAGKRPVRRADGGKWRIGYCESESFITYTRTLVGIVKGLEEIGWINRLEGLDQVAASGNSKIIWHWLASREVSPYIQFVDDACYNLREPGTDQAAILQRLDQKQDLDVMLVMGAAAGVLLSKADHTDIFVFAASNAVRSGIIRSAEDSGKDNVWAHMDPQRFTRQIKAFYDIKPFKRLGMVYEDSANARVYSAVNEVEALVRAKGFTIVRYHVREPRSPGEYPEYYRQVAVAYRALAPQVDAVYITVASLESSKLPELFRPFYEYKVPIFSQLGNIEVENGALLTVSVMDEVNIGRFGADTITKCLQGAKPRDLEQVYQSTPRISLNARVAKMMDFKLPFELAIVVDEVYQTIGTGDEQ
jgi:ABC-type uncharacterized transport system substrate-binding protein